MTRHEFLEALDISGDDLEDFLSKYDSFHDSLNSRQRALLIRSIPTIESARRLFGPDMTAEELTKMLDANQRHRTPVFCCFPLGQVKAD
jgi:hypothetical protein